MIRASIYRINDEINLTADEYIAYRKDEKEERFKYKKLIGIKNANDCDGIIINVYHIIVRVAK